jgi:hypothetical protein
MELVKVYEYREAMVHGVRFPMDHEWMQQLRELIPEEERDNHQVAIFCIRKNFWEGDYEFAVYFHDYHCFIGEVDSIQAGDSAIG